MFDLFRKLKEEFNNKIKELSSAIEEQLNFRDKKIYDVFDKQELKNIHTDDQLSEFLKEVNELKKYINEKLDSPVYKEMQIVQDYKENNPYFEIKSIEYSEHEGIKIKTDWNEAMIAFLRSHGYSGSEEDIIQRYLSNTFADQIQHHKLHEFN